MTSIGFILTVSAAYGAVYLTAMKVKEDHWWHLLGLSLILGVFFLTIGIAVKLWMVMP